MPVSLRLDDQGTMATYCTHKIGPDSLFIDGAPSLRRGQGIELIFESASGLRVAIDGIVEGHTGSKLFVSYRTLETQARERLEQIIWPSWDGANLLDGLILLAGRYGDATLKDWLRLTNLLGTIQPRLVHRRHAYA